MRQSSKPMFFNKVYVVKELMVGGSWRRREGGRRGRENETTQRKGNPNFKSHKTQKRYLILWKHHGSSKAGNNLVTGRLWGLNKSFNRVFALDRSPSVNLEITSSLQDYYYLRELNVQQ